MVFWPPFGQNYDYMGGGGIFKGGIPPVKWGTAPSLPTQIVVSATSPTHSGGYLRHLLAVEPEIMCAASANMQWGHFVSPSFSQKRESTAFGLILRNAWRLSSLGKQLGKSSTPCRKKSQVWGRESER